MKTAHKLSALSPIVKAEFLRVGGRLKHSLLNHDQTHPLILPACGKFTQILVRDCHARFLRGRVQLTLSTMRNEYWIIRGRQIVKSIIHKCLPCIRYRGTGHYQQMANLPAVRVRPGRPFSESGVDYAGPYFIRAARGRGHTSYKGYISIVVCLRTKAVHLEVVSSYDSPAFLAAFRRFCARRGHCKLLLNSDKELQQLFQTASTHYQQLTFALAQGGTTWKFKPPARATPNFGGIWEATVKSTKFHLRRLIGEAKLTYEDFSTLLCQIESCLNSRPLLTLTYDPSDLQPLTPAHFLIQSALYLIPEPDCIDNKIPLSKRWQAVQQMQQDYWKWWAQEYLQSLQRREKWRAHGNSFDATT